MTSLPGDIEMESSLREALVEALRELQHARVFISSRQKMHPDGVTLYDELVAKIHTVLCGGER